MSKNSFYTEPMLAEINRTLLEGQVTESFELLTEPLHKALYEQQSFDLLDELAVYERVALTFDYIRTQVDTGGFIQLIQNGYVSLLLTVIEGLQEMAIAEKMSEVLDDVLKVYVLNIEALTRETSVDEFARLYNEFKEFEGLEQQFEAEKEATMKTIIIYAVNGIKNSAS